MQQVLKELGLTKATEVTNQQLLEQFLNVSRCWANHDLAVVQEMSVERAINILREVRDASVLRRRQRLADAAEAMMWAIVHSQSEPQEAVAEGFQHKSGELRSLMDQPTIVPAVVGL